MIKKPDIEKFTNYNYFLVLTSFIVFVDSYFIYFLKLSIVNLNLEILKEKIGHILILLFLFVFIMAVVSKVATWIINFIYEYKFKSYDEKVDRSDYMFSDDILHLSINSNNSVLYNYYLQDRKETETIYKTQYLSTALILILICNFFVSTDTNISLMKMYELFFNKSEWYYIFINIIPIGTILFIAYSILNIGELYYIHLPKYIQENLEYDRIKQNFDGNKNANTK